MTNHEPALASAGALCRNIELKARLDSLEAARGAARRLEAAALGAQHQTDTYFGCPSGRLKLREIDDVGAFLISYARDDTEEAKASDYRIAAVEDPRALREVLAAACGVVTVVEKTREIFIYRNVRIHLDEVRGKGDFLEFEAVLDAQHDEEHARQLLTFLRGQFGIRSSDLLPSSYADMQ